MTPGSDGRDPAAGALVRFRRQAAWAAALATLGFLAYAIWKGLGQTAGELAAFAWPLYIPVLGLTLLNYGLRFWKWHFLLRALGVQIPAALNARIFVVGLAMVITPGKAGEIVKPWLVREAVGAPMVRTLPALVTERLTDGIAVVALAAVGVSTYYADGASLILATTAAIVLGLGILASDRASALVVRLLSSLPLVRRVGSRLEEARQAMRTCVAPVPLLLTVGASLVAWWAECVGYWLVLRGLGANAGLDASTFVYAFSTVFGAPSPGGLGMADAALAETAVFVVPGLGEPAALAAAVLIRIATLWFGVALGAIMLLRLDLPSKDP